MKNWIFALTILASAGLGFVACDDGDNSSSDEKVCTATGNECDAKTEVCKIENNKGMCVKHECGDNGASTLCGGTKYCQDHLCIDRVCQKDGDCTDKTKPLCDLNANECKPAECNTDKELCTGENEGLVCKMHRCTTCDDSDWGSDAGDGLCGTGKKCGDDGKCVAEGAQNEARKLIFSEIDASFVDNNGTPDEGSDDKFGMAIELSNLNTTTDANLTGCKLVSISKYDTTLNVPTKACEDGGGSISESCVCHSQDLSDSIKALDVNEGTSVAVYCTPIAKTSLGDSAVKCIDLDNDFWDHMDKCGRMILVCDEDGASVYKDSMPITTLVGADKFTRKCDKYNAIPNTKDNTFNEDWDATDTNNLGKDMCAIPK